MNYPTGISKPAIYNSFHVVGAERWNLLPKTLKDPQYKDLSVFTTDREDCLGLVPNRPAIPVYIKVNHN